MNSFIAKFLPLIFLVSVLLSPGFIDINYRNEHGELTFVNNKIEKYVVICTGRYAERYHSRVNCRGLNNCKGDIISVRLDEALRIGRTPCRICY